MTHDPVRTILPSMCAVAVLVVVCDSPIQAGGILSKRKCGCADQGHQMHQSFGYQYHHDPGPPVRGPMPGPPMPHVERGMMPPQPMANPSVVAVDMLRPPGTLGMTYRVKTREIPDEMHPRAAMLEVTVPSAAELGEVVEANTRVKVTVPGMDGNIDEDGIWRFDVKALVPGVPHIYDVIFELVRIESRIEDRHGRQYTVDYEVKIKDLGYRKVRLIPGRIVELKY